MLALVKNGTSPYISPYLPISPHISLGMGVHKADVRAVVRWTMEP